MQIPPDSAAASAIPHGVASIFQWLQWIVSAIIIPYGVYLVKRMDRQDEKLFNLDNKVTTVNTTLIGQDGKNGLRSRFNNVEDRVNELAIGMAKVGIEFRTPRKPSE